jgi:agmatine/peptidylarginine deiminase
MGFSFLTRLGLASFLVVGVSQANATVMKKSPSPAAARAAIENNEVQSSKLAEFGTLFGVRSSVRPFADYEQTGYVFISDSFEFSSKSAKEAIAANLPKDVTLVIFMEDVSGSRAASLRSSFSKYLPPERLKLVELTNADSGFWARDGLPIPVIDESLGTLSLVDARYYYPFEADSEVGVLMGAPVNSHKFNYEGGNFMANDKGHCIMVNNRSHARIPDSIFQTMYGCKQIDRLPHISGIGHIDEHVRWVSEDTVLTDLPDYEKTLKAGGLKVVMLPRPDNEIETYVNSLIVNGVAIVPVFGEKNDAAALAVYTSVGLKAVGADSESLSNDGEGSVHCITMTYPPVALGTILKSMGAREVH